MIKELEKHDAVHIWNNHYQGSFTPLAFDELLATNDIINQELWNQEIDEIKKVINAELFYSFLEQYQSREIDKALQGLVSFNKGGKEYFILNLCSNLKNTQFKVCFLLDQDYTVQYLCVDGKIEIATLPYNELNKVYNRYRQLIPPPLEAVATFNQMNEELSKSTGKNVDRTMYQVWFKLVPTIGFDTTFANAYNTFQSLGDALFGASKGSEKGGEFEYLQNN